MRKLSLSTVTAFLGLVGFTVAADLEVELPKKHFALIESYCLDCHDGETQKGKVNLEALSFKVGTLEWAELWQKVLNAMNSGGMPPENKRQPKNEEKAERRSREEAAKSALESGEAEDENPPESGPRDRD